MPSVAAMSHQATEAPLPRTHVEVVGTDGAGGQKIPVAMAHRWPPRLHRAFSVVLQDEGDRVLLQQRSMDKERWPGAWANACCGHPLDYHSLTQQAIQRVGEELGFSVAEGLSLVEAGTFIYRAQMEDGLWWEWEYDHVLVGTLRPQVEVRADPGEVAQVRWLTWDQAMNLAGTPEAAPWLKQVLQVAARTPTSVGQAALRA